MNDPERWPGFGSEFQVLVWRALSLLTITALICVGVLAACGVVAWSDAIGLVGVALAILFGTVALLSSAAQQRQLQSHAESLEQIRLRLEDEMSHAIRRVTDALQTVHIGTSPDFLPDITALVARATTSLTILCDHATTLIVSNGRAFDEYFQTLRQKLAACVTSPPAMDVEIIMFADAEQRELDRTQFGVHAATDAAWRRWVDAQITRDEGADAQGVMGGILPDLWERTGRLCGLSEVLPQDLTFDALIERLAVTDRTVREHYLAGATVHELRIRDTQGRPVARRDGPAVYLWMRDAQVPDEAEAIFVLVPQGAGADQLREVAFKTTDPQLIQALVGLFERYRLAATSQ